MSLPGRSRTPIGVDIGSAQIKAAQLVRTRRGWRVAALAACHRAECDDLPSEKEVERLAEVLERAGFEGADVVVGAPRTRLHTAMLELPPRKSGAPLEQICQAEISRMFRLAHGSYESFAWEVPTRAARSGTTQMAASVLPCTDASALASAFDRVGFEVGAIDITPEATARACAGAVRGLPELVAILDVGHAGLDLLVFRAGERVYQRRLEGIGVASLVQTLSRKLEIPARGAAALVRRRGLGAGPGSGEAGVTLARVRGILEEQLDGMLRETLASVSYALDRFPGESVTALRLVGGGAAIPGVVDHLARISGLEVSVCAPGEIARGFAARPEARTDPVYMTALGHALWGDCS